MNYAQLKASIASWAARPDVPIADVVAMAEGEIRRAVRVQAQEKLATGSLVGGAFAIPVDFLDSRQMLVGGERASYITPEEYQLEQEASSTLKRFARIGASFCFVGGTTQAYSLLYRAAFAPLSADADTNWVLTNAPDVYLYGCLKHAAIWAKDASAAQGYDAVFVGAVERLNATDRASMYAGPLVARVRGAV
jgi:hypothetical protein